MKVGRVRVRRVTAGRVKGVDVKQTGGTVKEADR